MSLIILLAVIDTCGAVNYGNLSSKKKTIDVKGWHKVPTSDKLECIKWLHAMYETRSTREMKIFTFVVSTLQTIASSEI